MKQLLFYLLILTVAIFCGVHIAKDPGYALFAYQHWTVEMPLWLAIFLGVFFVLALYYLISFLHSAGRLNRRYERWRTQNIAHKTNKNDRASPGWRLMSGDQQ